MSEYRHFIAYIYEYEEGKKLKNVGFVKVNIRGETSRMQIKIKTGTRENAIYTVYGFFHEEPWIYGIAAGKIGMKNGICENGLLVKETVFEERGYRFSDLSGLWIQRDGEQEAKKYFMTVWDERPVNGKTFVTELPQKEEEKKAEPQVQAAKEIEVQEMPEHTLKDRWEQFQFHYPQVTPFDDDEIVQCIQITPKDIAFLGGKEMTFCASPFVRQKYIKYRHLLLGLHKKGRYVLAVPGINRNIQDQNLAAMYGFPEYKEASEGTFGYWYHFL